MQPFPARFYFDEAIFRREHERLFHREWQFVGLTDDLASNGDFVCQRVGDYSVVVQNFEGELRAFLNVCSHRFAEIRSSECGNGPLRCPYHGWTYNSDGVPTGIPSRPYFRDLKAKIPGLALRRFAVDTCGRFVFVRITEDGPSLADALGGAATGLLNVSSVLDTRIDRTEWVFEANWKAVVENTIEGYHVGFVHPNTFKPLGIKGLDFRFDGPHSAYLGPFTGEAGTRGEKVRANFAERPFQPPGYFHQLIFPNFLTSTSYGIVASVQYHHALSPTRTRMVSYLYHRAPDPGSRLRPDMLDVLYDAARRFNVTTLEEDRAIVESVQRGVVQTSQPGLLSDEEARIVQFHATYLAAIGNPERASADRGDAGANDAPECGAWAGAERPAAPLR